MSLYQIICTVVCMSFLALVHQLFFPHGAVARHVELASGGVAWFQDLTSADPYLALPCVLVAANLLNIEVSIKQVDVHVYTLLSPLPSPPCHARCMQFVLGCSPKGRLCSPNFSDTSQLEWVSLRLSSQQYVCQHALSPAPPIPPLPSPALFQAMSLYWASSSVFGLLQNMTLKVPWVRRSLHIPKTPSEHRQPFQAILQAWRQRAETFLQHQRRHQ